MTHFGMGAKARQVAGITEGLLRLSIGLEAEADLVEDLEKALSAAAASLNVSDAPVKTASSAIWPQPHRI
jgi:hypothetical protein